MDVEINDRCHTKLYKHPPRNDRQIKLQENVKVSFKKCMIDDELIDIGYFGKYERSDKVQRLVFNYNQSVGKNADSIYNCTVNAFDDINYYMDIWKPYTAKLSSVFGIQNLDFSPINHRVTAFGHDRHVVNDKLYELYKVDLMPELKISASCTKHDKGNGVKAGQLGLKESHEAWPELNEYGTTTSGLTFIIRKFKLSSSYPHQKAMHLIAHVFNEYGQKAMIMVLFIFRQKM